MWPLAIMTFLHKVILVPQNKHETDDFTTVWSALRRFVDHIPVYSENYATVDPHYLYSPGGTLLLSPLALAPLELGRSAYILANGIAIVLALAILCKLFGFSLKGWLWPTSIALLFMTESVKNTLLFSNINGILLLLQVVFLWLLLKRRDLLAGIAIGLAITVKPQFAPLLFLPLVRRQWGTLVTGLGLPIAFNLAAWPLMERPRDFFDVLLPYLGHVRDYANSSISGVGVYFGLPEWGIFLLRAIAAAFVAAAVLGLLRWRNRDEVMWATTTSSILLIGVFLISSLGQMYYTMLIVPMLFTTLQSRSVMHNPIAWLGVYFSMSIDDWMSDRWVWAGRTFEYIRGTVGWSLLIIAAGTAATLWWLEDTGRLTRRASSGQARDHMNRGGQRRHEEV